MSEVLAAPSPAFSRKAGAGQGITLVTASFLPILAIVSLTTAVPTIIDHFAGHGNIALDVTMMVSAPGLAIALIAPFAGLLADRLGRRTLLVWATLFYGVVGVAPLFLTTLPAIIATRLLLGAAEAFILTLVNTLIGDYWDQAGRRRWLVIQGVVGPAVATGVIAASGALTALHWNAVFAIYSVAFPIFIGMWLYIFEPAPHVASLEEPRASVAGRNFPAGRVAVISATTLFASALFYVFIIQGGLVFREVGVVDPARLGVLVSFASLAVPVGALLFGYLSRRPITLQLLVFFGMMGAGLAGIGASRDSHWMFAALLVQQTAAGMSVPLLIAWAVSSLPFEHRGRGMGFWTAAFFLGQFASPLLVNVARAMTGSVRGAFVVAGIFGLAGAAISLLCLLRQSSPSLKPQGSMP